MFYCDQCGAATKPNAKYCHLCGNRVEVEGSVSGVVEPIKSRTLIDTRDDELRVEEPVETERSKQDVEATTAKHILASGAWRRWFARVVDMAVASPMLVWLLIYIVEFLVGTDGAAAFSTKPWLISMAIFALWVPVEAAFLWGFGTTPGKAAFGIQIRDEKGNLPTYKHSLSRAIDVYMLGMALGIPIVMWVTWMLAYRRVVAKGCAHWDSGLHEYSVTYKNWGVLHKAVAVVAVLVAAVCSSLVTPIVIDKHPVVILGTQQ